MTLACDISNYTDPLTPEKLQALKAAGIELVIVQAVDPPPGFPAGKTREQIQACLDAGLVVDAYVWLWFDLDVSDIQAKLALLDGLPIRQLWLDVEDQAAARFTTAMCIQKVSDALAACDSYTSQHASAFGSSNEGAKSELTGVYSGRWFWTDWRYMGNTTAFADRELWDSNYDDVVDTISGFVPYGGWTSCAIKQYHGTTSLAGIGGLDLNVLSVAEDAELHQPTQEDDVQIPQAYQAKFSIGPTDVQGLIDHFEGVITTVRDIALAEGEAAGADAQAKLEQIKAIVAA